MIKNDVRRWFASPLSRQYVKWTFLFGAFATLLATFIDAGIYYRNQRQIIYTQVEKLTETYSDSLTISLWDFNNSWVDDTLTSIIRTTNATYAEIKNSDKIRSAGKPATGSFAYATKELIHAQNGVNYIMGQFTIEADLRPLAHLTIWHAFDQFVANSIKALFLLVFSLFVFDRLVNRHLVYIREKTKSGALMNATSAPYELDRPVANQRNRDELDTVVGALNDMKGQISKQITELSTLSKRRLEDFRSLEILFTRLGFYFSYYNSVGKKMFSSADNQKIEEPLRVFMSNPIFSGMDVQHYAKKYGLKVVNLPILNDEEQISKESRLLYAMELNDGANLFLHIYGIRFDDGTMAVVLSDQSALHSIQTDLQNARKLEALGTLSGSVAHEFKNHLAIIQANTEAFLANGRTNSQQKQAIANVDKTLERASRVVSNLLGPLRKNNESEAPPMAVSILIDQAVHDAKAVSDIDTKVTVKIEDNFKLKVANSPFQGALFNLIKNASEAMKGAGEVIVICRNANRKECNQLALSSLEEYAAIEVRDTGEGIPPERAHHVFEPFYTTKKSSSGTGLGLWSVYNFCRTSNGSVRYLPAYQPNGQQSRFVMYLPIAEEIANLPNAKPTPSTKPADFSGKNVLIVEDEPFLLRSLENCFLSTGAKTETAASIGEARLKLLKEEFQMLICDYRLTDGIGLQICEQHMHANPNGVRIIFSGNPDPACRSAKCVDEVIEKPVKLVYLLKKLETLTREKNGASLHTEKRR